MKLLKRNCVPFTYKPYLGASDYDEETDTYSGEPVPVYGESVNYFGNKSAASGFALTTMFGADVRYTHVILLDNPKADIRESGRIQIGDETYEVTAVRPSLNVLAIAVQQLTRNRGTL